MRWWALFGRPPRSPSALSSSSATTQLLDTRSDANGIPAARSEHVGSTPGPTRPPATRRGESPAAATRPTTGSPPAVDLALRHRVLARRRRHQPAADPADRARHLPGHHRQLEDREVRRAYLVLLLMLETGVLGRSCPRFLPLLRLLGGHAAADVLPHRPLGRGRREYAAIKFVLYTLLGSVFILIAIIGLYFTDVRDFVDRSDRRSTGRPSDCEGRTRVLTEHDAAGTRSTRFDFVTLCEGRPGGHAHPERPGRPAGGRRRD